MVNSQALQASSVPAEQLVIITPRIEVWSGTVQVQRDRDLTQVNGQLPPKGLVSDGRKALIGPEPLRPMLNVRKSIERTLKQDGFTGLVGTGIAVTADKANEFLEKVPAFKKEFDDAVQSLVDNIDQHYESQETLYPHWAQMLKSSRLAGEEIRSRCKFSIAVFRLAAPDPTKANSAANDHYQQMTQDAVPTLLGDIARDAAELMPRFEGKSSVKQTQVVPVWRLVDKLLNFAFLDPRIQPSASSMRTILDGISTTGPLNPTETTLCLTILQQLAKPATLLTHGSGVIRDLKAPTKAVQGDLSYVHEIEPTTTPPPMPSKPVQRNAFSVSL